MTQQVMGNRTAASRQRANSHIALADSPQPVRVVLKGCQRKEMPGQIPQAPAFLYDDYSVGRKSGTER